MFPTRRVRGVCDVCETATWKATRRPTVNIPSHKFKHRNRISKTHLIWRNSDLLIIICGFLLREHFPWSFPCQAERWATCPSNSAIKWQSPRVKPRSVPPWSAPDSWVQSKGFGVQASGLNSSSQTHLQSPPCFHTEVDHYCPILHKSQERSSFFYKGNLDHQSTSQLFCISSGGQKPLAYKN